MMNDQTACHLVETAADAILADPGGFGAALDELPAAIYVTDTQGTIVYFNPKCVELAGRTPRAGTDKWCVTWKLFTPDNEALPHSQCPMAVAIRDRKPVRNVEAIAERPDGTRLHLLPFPTPLFDGDGRFAGAVNLLLDVTEKRTPDYLRKQASRCRRLAAACGDPALDEALTLMASKYDDQAHRLTRPH